MKKLTMICMSALLLMAASCKKDKKDEIENAGSGFRATVESHEVTGKTHLDEGKFVKWDSGDAILVKSSTCSAGKRFTTTGSGLTVNFEAAESLPDNFYTPDYTGYYPAAAFSGDQLTLPATQDYVENSFASGANPMAAQSASTELLFKNICGVLKLQLYSTTSCQVRSISITSNTGEQLCGTGTVTLTDGIPALGTLTGGGSTLTLGMGTGGAAMSTNENAPTAYYFVVPAGTLGTSFTVKVTDTDGKVWSKTAYATLNKIERNKITVMPKLAVTRIPEGALPGLFTVNSSGKQVYFSKGNLQFHTTDKKWQFANNQYDVCNPTTGIHTTNDYAENSGKWIDLFGWGSTGNAPVGDAYYVHYQPWSTDNSSSGHSSDYNGYGYGPSTNSSEPNLSVSNGSDWGRNIGDGNTWRTLTSGEWSYLINTREVNGKTGYGNTCVWATVEGVRGLIIFHDGYTGATSGLSSIPDDCVFLPAAGYRLGHSVYGVGSEGYYWSSSHYGSYDAYHLDFGSGYVNPYDDDEGCRYLGFSVRLVSEN